MTDTPENETGFPEIPEIKGIDKLFVKSDIKVRILKVMAYRGIDVYIRQIGEEYFEWLFYYDKGLFSSYMQFKPDQNKKTITKKQIKSVVAYIFSGAITTIDILYKTEEEKKKGLLN